MGDSLVVWINPSRLPDFTVGDHFPRASHLRKRMQRLGVPLPIRILIYRVMTKMEPYVIPERYFERRSSKKDERIREKIENFIANRDDVSRSLWHQKLIRQLTEDGVAKHKSIVMRGAEDIDNFLQHYALDLIRSMESDGYEASKAGDTGAARIDREGNLIKGGSATHRFFVARALGVSKFPMQVCGVHEAWAASVSDADGRLSSDRLAAWVQEIAANYR